MVEGSATARRQPWVASAVGDRKEAEHAPDGSIDIETNPSYGHCVSHRGDVDISAVGQLLADPGRFLVRGFLVGGDGSFLTRG